MYQRVYTLSLRPVTKVVAPLVNDDLESNLLRCNFFIHPSAQRPTISVSIQYAPLLFTLQLLTSPRFQIPAPPAASTLPTAPMASKTIPRINRTMRTPIVVKP
eukprot:gb/GEZJ01006129.1/.p2 GENE.gb/GEZJ01006129.1/~~gb/GEZJ01006129.1/.p2  ORF type:complete len:103 (-),score=0.57 gb/GEZJ01006129.1/:644-952(-)